MTIQSPHFYKSIALTALAFSAGLFLGILLFATSINLFLRKVWGPAVLPYPSAKQVGTNYLAAVIADNKAYIPEHNSCTHTDLISDIKHYGGAKIKDISVQSEWRSGNSNHTFEITTIRFAYRQPHKDWQSGEITLMTASNLLEPPILPFRKIICSGG